jgi:CHAT domain-containing protein/Flp pilus assembly protein TadD
MEKKNYESALIWAKLSVNQSEKEFGKDTNYTASVSNLYQIFFNLQKLDSAIYYCVKALQIHRTNYKEVNIGLANNISWLGFLYNYTGEYKLAEPLYIETMEMYRRIFNNDHPDLAVSISNLADFFYRRGKYTEAEPLYEESLNMRKRLYKGDHPEVAKSINNMAVFYRDIGRFVEAERLFKEALEMSRNLFKGDHPYLAGSILSMGYFYKGKGNYIEAEKFFKEALEMFRRIYKEDHPNLATSIDNMASIYFKLGDYISSEQLYNESLEMRRRLFKKNHPDLVTSVNNLAQFYNFKGRYTEAGFLYEQALEMSRQLFQNDHPDLIISLSNMATFLIGIGNYADSESLLTEALEMSRRVFKKDHPNLAELINNMAVFYETKGNYADAESLYMESLEMKRRIYKKDHPDLALSIGNTAAFFKEKGFNDNAELLLKEALEMNRRIYKNDHPQLARSIHNLAILYLDLKRLSDAETLLKEALEMKRRIYKSDHPDLALSIQNMAVIHKINGNYQEAEILLKEAFEIYRRIYIDAHPDLAISLNFLITYYSSTNRFIETEVLFYELIKICYNLINNFFPYLSENEKEKYFTTFFKYYYKFNIFVIRRYKTSPKLLETFFDNQLMIKGMLLNSSNKVRRNILSSNDTLLITLYHCWKDKKEFISKLYKLSRQQLEKKRINLDSIIRSANELEKELTSRSDIFSQENEKKKPNWKDIKKYLKINESVIELVRINIIDKNDNKDTINYAALILKKNSKYPELVLLENGNELETKYISNYNQSVHNKIEDKDSYKQFWEPIAKKLKGIKKVFISPDGVYNKINLATLQNPKTGKYVIDEIDIQVVGSTRDLVEKKIDSRFRGNDTLPKVAELFGNPQFNLESTQYSQIASRYADGTERSYYYLGNTLDSTTRKGIAPLPGTKTEIDNISSILTNNKWKVNTHLGSVAVEEAIKSLMNPTILHIATHGMFLKDIETTEENILGMEVQRVKENPLLRSMLLLSGAENTLKNESSQYQQTDDGLLTAYEAMNLNLDKTELVVLSACETGLGEIKNGEGVYGLQRAFQQAGAKSVLMSLWKVNDEATQELMTTFYKEWVSGKTKREAFNTAQKKIRDKYKHPYYWGAFVMVGE